MTYFDLQPSNAGRLSLTLPAVVANAQLLAGEVAVAAVGAAAVVATVRDVASFPLPVLVALAVHAAGRRVARRALPVARAVAGTRVDPGHKRGVAKHQLIKRIKAPPLGKQKGANITLE